MRARPTLPTGHGELLTQPAFDSWGDLVERNRRERDTWSFVVAGLPASELCRLARTELLDGAGSYSRRIGVPLRASRAADAPLVVTGHQPDLYHPGVWVKCFLLQRLADDLGANAVDLVVDSDGFGSVAATTPCMRPEVTRCTQYLAVGAEGACYGCTPTPDERTIALFCGSTAEALSTLAAPALSRHFGTFCAALDAARVDAGNLAELVTFARRRYEAPSGTDYLESPVTALAAGDGFARFVVHVSLEAERFAGAYNGELREYRARTGTRSSAQPFPDLRVDGAAVELPFWLLAEGRRHALHARPVPGGVELSGDGGPVAVLPPEGDAAVAALRASGAQIVPKALSLTLFTRLFASDLFIHGVGGGRYDRVTDGVIRRFFGVEAPAFAVASLTLYLPLGAHVVTDDEVALATERLNRVAHNPDALLGEAEFDSADERERAYALAAQKARLVNEIAMDGADKKSLGRAIREVNEELADVLSPVREALTQELAHLESERDASQILTARDYPFCFWDPTEVADKVR